MSNCATAPAEPLHPDPDRAVSARPDSAGIGNILRLLRTLFAYGSNLVEKLREEDDPDDLPWYAFLTRIFGTIDPALITVTIIRGLLRATALQVRLSKSVAASLLPLPLREAAGGRRGPSRGPSRVQMRAARWTIPPGWPAGDFSLGREPTPEEEMFAEIVAEDRDRPIGPILLDICLDLGIVPALMDSASWDELHLAITLYGGDPATLMSRWANRQNCADPDADPVRRNGEAHSATGTLIPNFDPVATTGQPSIVFPPWPAPSPQSPVPTCTGPP